MSGLNGYSPALFGAQINSEIAIEVQRAMQFGYTKNQAAMVVAQAAISCALGFSCGAAGRLPDPDQMRQLTSRIIGLVYELPQVPSQS